jgi:hypothetical protein
MTIIFLTVLAGLRNFYYYTTWLVARWRRKYFENGGYQDIRILYHTSDLSAWPRFQPSIIPPVRRSCHPLGADWCDDNHRAMCLISNQNQQKEFHPSSGTSGPFDIRSDNQPASWLTGLSYRSQQVELKLTTSWPWSIPAFVCPRTPLSSFYSDFHTYCRWYGFEDRGAMFELRILKPWLGATNSYKKVLLLLISLENKQWWCGLVHDQDNARQREIINAAS